jgi:deazaflavin-dependent oxidoreductase (nitroreductase family)
MVSKFKMTKARRRVNAFTMWLARRGWGQQVVLTTTGRVSGSPHRVPVSPLDVKGIGYLVSPYGEMDWVRNVRANPNVNLREGKRSRDVTLAEVPPARCGDLLFTYWTQEKITRPYFDVPAEPTKADFDSDAAGHPIFKIIT